MKALIFAAGLGSRLGSITEKCPKALVKVGGEPMLKQVLLKLKANGINEFVINVHHHSQMIIDYLRENNYFGANIDISDESSQLLDTGGGLLKARKFLQGSEPVIMHNADILTDFNLQSMMKQHSDSGADVTLLVDKRDTSRYLLFDRGMRMCGWTDMRTGEIRTPYNNIIMENYNELAFGGVHIVNPAIFNELEKFSEDPKFSITPFYISACKTLRIMGFIPQKPYHWIDIGKPKSLIAAQSIVSELRPTTPEEC